VFAGFPQGNRHPGTRRVFEVLSDSTARSDHIEKLREYAATASILRYVILEQDSIGAMVFTRKDGQFVAETLTDGDTLRIPEIGVEVAMADFYEGVEPSAGAE
jgi:Uma2 family endonuclease